MQFKDKVVWITGASSGIGEALAKGLSRRGAKLVLSGRREQELERVRKEIVAAGGEGQRIALVPFDVTDESGLDDVVASAHNTFGRIDALINNAGISQRSLVRETHMSVYRKLMEVNFFAPVALTKKVLPIMAEQRSGLVVVTSSIAGKVGAQLRSGYCASKHAVQGFFDALRAEVAADGIQVVTVQPGFIHTHITEHALKGDGTAFGEMSSSIAGGMDVNEAAGVIIRGLEAGKLEIPVGHGREMNLLWLKRVSPNTVFRMMEKVRAD